MHLPRHGDSIIVCEIRGDIRDHRGAVGPGAPASSPAAALGFAQAQPASQRSACPKLSWSERSHPWLRFPYVSTHFVCGSAREM
jgi:hypothetical protein